MDALTRPHRSILHPTARFQARIVTITVLILLTTIGLSVFAQSDLSPLTLLLLFIGYFISRTKYYILSAFLVITNISFFVFIALFDSSLYSRETVFMTIAWLTPSLILAGLIFSIRQMVLIGLIHLLIPLSLPLLLPELDFEAIFVGSGYVLVVSAMIIVSMYLRNLLEQEKQRELARLNEELEDRVFDRTAQLESFSYSVSHDLRAPLRAIRGYSEILTSEYTQALDPEGQTYLGRIKKASEKMDHLIDDMLKLSRLGRKDLEYESINLAVLAETIFQELVGAEEHAERFQFTSISSPEVMADRQLVTILLTNLLSNAIKFSRRQQPAEIVFGYHLQAGQPEFFLKDNGVGFDAQLTEQVLRPFQRLHSDEEYEGTGVGLAIVNNIIQRHSGLLRIESKLDEGTTVYFRL